MKFIKFFFISAFISFTIIVVDLNILIPFLILFNVVVFCHEYGHYYFARKYKVGVTHFSIGIGNELFGFTDKNGTRWRFSLFPIGGYLRFFGDRNVYSEPKPEEILKKYREVDKEKLLFTKPLYQRSLIVLGGPLANFLLAILIFTSINMFAGKDFTPPKIEEVTINSPAEKAGLKKNDIIIGINNYKVESILEVSTYINTNNADKLKIQVLRDQKKISLVAIPEIIDSKDPLGNSVKKKIIGIKIGPANNEFNKEKLGPTKAVYYAVKEIWFVSKTTIQFVGSMFQGKADTSQLGGPIKIAKISGQVMEFGILAFLSTIAYISISLGLINLFPIPILDGGHLMLFLIEKIKGKPLSIKTQEGLFRIGLVLLVSLILIVTFNDIKDL